MKRQNARESKSNVFGLVEMKRDLYVYIRLIQLLNKYNRKWLVIYVNVLMDGILPFVTIYLSSMLLDALYEVRSVREMILWAFLGAAIALLVTVIKHFAIRQKNIMWWGMQHRMAEPLMKKTLEMDYALTEDGKVRALRARLEENRKKEKDVFERFLEQFEILLIAIVKLVLSIVTVIPFLGALMISDNFMGSKAFLILLLGVFLGISLVIHWSIREQGNKKQKIYKEHEDENRLNDYMMNKVVLSIEAGKDIRIFRQQKMMGHYGDQMNANWRKMTRQYAANDVFHMSLQGVLSACIGGIVYLYVAICAYWESISVGNVVRYAGAVQQLIQALTDILSSWSKMHGDRVQMDEYLNYLDLENQMDKGINTVDEKQCKACVIEFKNVSFLYPGTDRYVFKNLNVKLSFDEHIAIVGRNGSGKTTFVKLLCRLYDPTEGAILLNGVDIKQYDQKEYRKLFSVVFQDFHIFSTYFGENIAGSADVNEEKTLDAIMRSGLDKLYQKMPDGLQTIINRGFANGGRKISGGETQKLALARAIYKDAPLVILDEPTAALDPIAEDEIYSGFHEIAGQKPVIFISHRLSACRFATEILVFENGEIVQRGDHRKLELECGLYREMWAAQAQYYQQA